MELCESCLGIAWELFGDYFRPKAQVIYIYFQIKGFINDFRNVRFYSYTDYCGLKASPVSFHHKRGPENDFVWVPLILWLSFKFI